MREFWKDSWKEFWLPVLGLAVAAFIIVSVFQLMGWV